MIHVYFFFQWWCYLFINIILYYAWTFVLFDHKAHFYCLTTKQSYWFPHFSHWQIQAYTDTGPSCPSWLPTPLFLFCFTRNGCQSVDAFIPSAFGVWLNLELIKPLASVVFQCHALPVERARNPPDMRVIPTLAEGCTEYWAVIS